MKTKKLCKIVSPIDIAWPFFPGMIIFQRMLECRVGLTHQIIFRYSLPGSSDRAFFLRRPCLSYSDWPKLAQMAYRFVATVF